MTQWIKNINGQNIQMTDEEISQIQAQQAAWTTKISAEALKERAQFALDASDMTAIRCLKAGIAFPSEWQTYVAALRAIVNGANGPLPNKPTYPQGT